MRAAAAAAALRLLTVVAATADVDWPTDDAMQEKHRSRARAPGILSFPIRARLRASGTQNHELQPHFLLRASGPALIVGNVSRSSGSAPAMPSDVQVITERDDEGAAQTLVAHILLPVPGVYLLEIIKLFDDLDEHAPDTSEALRVCHSHNLDRPYFLGRVLVTTGPRPSKVQSKSGENDSPGIFHGWLAHGAPGYVWTRMQDCSNTQYAHNGNTDVQRDNMFNSWAERPPPMQPLLGHAQPGMGVYRWSRFNGTHTHAVPMHRGRVSDVCFFGGSHARDIAADVPGSFWIGAKFSCEGLYDQIQPNAKQRFRLVRNAAGLVEEVRQNNLQLADCRHIVLVLCQWDLG